MACTENSVSVTTNSIVVYVLFFFMLVICIMITPKLLFSVYRLFSQIKNVIKSHKKNHPIVVHSCICIYHISWTCESLLYQL